MTLSVVVTRASLARVSVGTSGWSYPSWKPDFYPAGTDSKQFLGFYSEQFSTVELNTTGYRLPAEEQFARWAEQTPPGFTFAPKLAGNRPRIVAEFGARVRLLEDLRLAEQRLQEIRRRPDASKAMVALVESDLESLRASLNREARLETNAVHVQLEINKAERESLTNQIAELRSYIESKAWSQLEAGRRDWAFYEGVYQDYLTRIEAAQRGPQTRSNLRIVSEALPPVTPSSPNQKVVLALSATIGVFLGIGLAMLREWNLHARPPH